MPKTIIRYEVKNEFTDTSLQSADEFIIIVSILNPDNFSVIKDWKVNIKGFGRKKPSFGWIKRDNNKKLEIEIDAPDSVPISKSFIAKVTCALSEEGKALNLNDPLSTKTEEITFSFLSDSGSKKSLSKDKLSRLLNKLDADVVNVIKRQDFYRWGLSAVASDQHIVDYRMRQSYEKAKGKSFDPAWNVRWVILNDLMNNPQNAGLDLLGDIDKNTTRLLAVLKSTPQHAPLEKEFSDLSGYLQRQLFDFKAGRMKHEAIRHCIVEPLFVMVGRSDLAQGFGHNKQFYVLTHAQLAIKRLFKFVTSGKVPDVFEFEGINIEAFSNEHSSVSARENFRKSLCNDLFVPLLSYLMAASKIAVLARQVLDQKTESSERKAA